MHEFQQKREKKKTIESHKMKYKLLLNSNKKFQNCKYAY